MNGAVAGQALKQEGQLDGPVPLVIRRSGLT